MDDDPGFGQTRHNDPLSRFLRWQYYARRRFEEWVRRAKRKAGWRR